MDQRPELSRVHSSGLLGLQNALKDLEAVAGAFRDWSGDPAESPLEVLIETAPVGSLQRELIEGLAGLVLEREGADSDQDPGSLDSSARSRLSPGGTRIHFPLVSPMVRQRLEAPTDERGHRFQILRLHAEGGLGSVSIAMDRELHREVALKQILDRHADDAGRRTRFLAEAEITGGLEHPGIVPVYSLGHGLDGRPFYAMRLIRGETLAEAIARFHEDKALRDDPSAWSLELRKLLRRFVDVCNAIEYAHGRGILHRDLKPSNVMVGKHGETLVVDWGLAKSIHEVDAGHDEEGPLLPSSGGGRTLPGSAVGTPAYMSPEQASGDHPAIGARSDVYSLGATLYCLLTGRPAFEADDPHRVLREVQEGVFPAPRRLNNRVPGPLEAICLKAMARLPVARYPSARDLADDIERWMADEPVSALRESLMERGRRWARRRRSTVTAALAALIVALTGSMIVLGIQSQANERLRASVERETQSNGELRRANERVALVNAELIQANQRERHRLDLALEAIRLFHGEVGDNLLLKEVEFAGLRSNLLRGAVRFYGQLRKDLDGRSDRASREEVARVQGRIAELEATLGTGRDALNSLQQALDLRRELARSAPDDPRTQTELASCLISQAMILKNVGPLAEAFEPLEEAREILEELGLKGRDDPKARALLGDCHQETGIICMWMRHDDLAIAAFERALALREPLAHADLRSSQAWSSLATTCLSKGAMELQNVARRPDARRSLTRAREIIERLNADDPTNVRYQSELAALLKDLGDLMSFDGEHAEAIRLLERSLAIREQLSFALPASKAYRIGISHNLMSLGFLFQELGRRTESAAAFRRSAALQENVPGNRISHYNLACTRAALSVVGDPRDAALEASRASRALNDAVSAGFRDLTALRRMGGRYPALGADPVYRMLMLDQNFPGTPFGP